MLEEDIGDEVAEQAHGEIFPKFRACSVRTSPWRPHLHCDLKAGEETGWVEGRKEEWLGRSAGFHVEEMTGAKSGGKREHDPFVELLTGYPNLNRMTGWFSALVVYSTNLSPRHMLLESK